MLLSLLYLAASAAAQGALTINTPCQPVQLSWVNGRAPFYPAAIPAGQANTAPLAKFPPQEGNAFTWVVNLRAGTQVTIQITDATGTTAYSSPLGVQEGFDDKCLSEAVNVTSATPAAGNATNATAPAGNATGASAAPPSSNGPSPTPEGQAQNQTASPGGASPTPEQQQNTTAVPPAGNDNASAAALSASVPLVVLAAALAAL